MPFARPALSDLVSRAEADFEVRLEDADARLRAAVLNVLARVLAGGEHGLYGYLEWISKQVLVDTAEDEQLDRHGAIWGITRKPATYATGTATLTGSNGSTAPADRLLRRADGVQYRITADATISAGTAAAAIEAEAAGIAGNADVGVALSLVLPIAGIVSSASVAGPGLAGGADAEANDDYRARILTRIQEPPHGGNYADYERWALEVVGVTRAWVFPLESGPGTVALRFMMDGTYAGGIPHAGDVTAVQTHIDAVRPVTADVLVAAPAAVAMPVTIDGLTPDTAAVRAAIAAELADLVLREAEPGGTILLSHVREAISRAAGETDHALTAPSADVSRASTEITVLGTITYT